jgi:heme-degrading monooxygenase HmoA
MIAVIFEAEFDDTDKAARYFEIAQSLRPNLDRIEGFVSIERFQSVTTPNKILSYSLWENERAIGQWREHPDHAVAQETGKRTLFKSYRIAVADVNRVRSG